MVPSLDGVMHVMVVIEPVLHVHTVRRKLMPSPLLGLGTPSPPAMLAIARGIIVVAPRQWVMRIRVVPIDYGQWLGQPRGGSVAP